MAKRKRRKRKSRYKGTPISANNLAPDETPKKMREKFPEKLIDTFVAVVKADWSDTAYKKYVRQAKAFLGTKWNDKIDQGRLVVQLSRATSDLLEGHRREKALARKLTCEEHPKYKGLRSPRTDCKKCWSIYNAKKTDKQKGELKKMKCAKHPKYQGIRKPRADCKPCWDIYNAKKTKKKKTQTKKNSKKTA